MKYHNGANGPAICKAEVRACPVGSESEHFSTEKEARTVYEENMAKTHGAFTSVSRQTEAAQLNVRASKAIQERDALGRAESILAAAESDTDQVAMDKAWSEVKDLDSMQLYKDDDRSTVSDMADTVELARSDVEMTLTEYSDTLDSLEADEPAEAKSKLDKLDPLQWESWPSNAFRKRHGFGQYHDRWQNFRTEDGNKLHVVTNEHDAPGQAKYFVAYQKHDPKEFETLYRTPREITETAARDLGYSDD